MLLALVLLATVGVLAQLMRFVKVSNRLAGEVQKQLTPVSEHAQSVGENLAYVSAVVRQDVTRLSDSVNQLTARLNQASDRMEERIEEFNALLEVAQDEAENLFIDTAATVRGVTAGARSLTAPDEPPSEPEAEEP